MNFRSVAELETEACRSIFEYKYFGVLPCECVHMHVCTCVYVSVCQAALGGASGTDARQFTVWNLMGSGNVLYALASMIHYG